jgi:hypothetical protein
MSHSYFLRSMSNSNSSVPDLGNQNIQQNLAIQPQNQHQNQNQNQEANNEFVDAVNHQLPMVAAQAQPQIYFKPPPFNKANVKIWFLQLEAHFSATNVTSDTQKFYGTVSMVDPAVLPHIKDVLTNPPESTAYETLKQRIIAHYSESEQRQLQKLLTELQLGDRKPSELLRQMEEYAHGNIVNSALKTLWLQRLPHNMRAILSTSEDDLPLPKLAQMADKIADSLDCKPSYEAAAIQRPTATDNTTQLLQSLVQQVATLSERLMQLEANNQQPRRSFNSSRSQSRQRFSSRSPNRSPPRQICFYHERFGRNARRCTKPCIFAEQLQQGNE